MSLLGIDTATAATSVCILRGDGAAFERSPGPERLAAAPAHAGELMPAVAAALADAGLDWPELRAIAVGRGPGAFTGLRIGIATARGLALAHGLPLRPVSSLAALAAGIAEEARAEAPAPGEPLVLPLIDARRGELFGALWRGAELVWEPFVARPETVAERLRDAGFAPLAAGDGSLRFRQILEAAGVRVAPERSRLHVVRALHVCRLAASAPDTPPEAVLPHYLRAPDATPR